MAHRQTFRGMKLKPPRNLKTFDRPCCICDFLSVDINNRFVEFCERPNGPVFDIDDEIDSSTKTCSFWKDATVFSFDKKDKPPVGGLRMWMIVNKSIMPIVHRKKLYYPVRDVDQVIKFIQDLQEEFGNKEYVEDLDFGLERWTGSEWEEFGTVERWIA